MDKSNIKVSIAGCTGRLGRACIEEFEKADDITIESAAARATVGKSLGELNISKKFSSIIVQNIESALLTPFDVFVDYTTNLIAFENAKKVISSGRHVVTGVVGITEQQWEELHLLAQQFRVTIIASNNFALTYSLLQNFACNTVKHVSEYKISDTARPHVYSPLGTSLELSNRLEDELGLDENNETRSKDINSTRLPGMESEIKVVFGCGDEQLTISHTSLSAQPYANGTLIAIRSVGEFSGLIRGLDKVIFKNK